MKFYLLVITVSFFLIPNSNIAQTDVFVEVGESSSMATEGYGVIKSRSTDGTCFLIIPKHVIEDDDEDIVVSSSFFDRKSIKLVDTLTSDISIWKFTEAKVNNCSNWRFHKDESEAIDKSESFFFEILSENGNKTKFNVEIFDIAGKFLRVVPRRDKNNFNSRNKENQFFKGISGSSLYCLYNNEKIYLGMIQKIEDNIGYILKASELDKLVSFFFNPDIKGFRDHTKGPSIGLKDTIDGIELELVKIENTSIQKNLIFKITSMESDELIYIRDSYIVGFDENGNETHANKVEIGSKTGSSIQYQILKNIPVNFVVQFNDLPSYTNAMERLSLGFYKNNQKFTYSFKKIILGEVEKTDNVSGNIKYDLIHISRNQDIVTCHFNVTAIGKDTEVYLRSDNSVIYNDKGYEVQGNSATFGSRQGSNFSYRLIQDISTPLEISFKDVPTNSSSLALLRIVLNDGRMNRIFESRNIDFDQGEFESNSDCSEITFYRMKGTFSCDEPVRIKSNDRKWFDIAQGEIHKIVTCNEVDLNFNAFAHPYDSSLTSNQTKIELGNNYFFKIGCSLGYAKIYSRDNKKAKEELSKKKKYSGTSKKLKLPRS